MVDTNHYGSQAQSIAHLA